MIARRRLIAVLLLLSASGVFAPRVARAQAPPTTPLAQAQSTALESEIGRLMQRRGETGTSAVAMLELRIDARIVARWLLDRAAAAPADSDLQACAWIRAVDLQAAIKRVEGSIDPDAAESAQLSLAAKALHELTFKLGEAQPVAELDAVCRVAALALAAAASPPLTDAKLPPMRPAPLPAPAGPVGAPGAAAGPRTLGQLAARAKELAVSVGLRKQLLQASHVAAAAAGDPARAEEAALLRTVFEEAVVVAEGLHSNTAVEREDRVKMESQLAEGLAMSLDVRTRALGQKRVAGLGQYRQLLTRVEGMRLPPELLKRFGPALAWARQNLEGPGAELMAAIELFLQQDARLSALKPDATSAGGGNYTKAAKHARDAAVRARETFVEAAAVPTHFKKPESLKRQAEQMRTSMDALATIGATPEAMRVLNGLKPKPFGGIDKRVQAALTAWGPDGTDATREVSAAFLANIVRLGEFAREANAPPAPGAVAAEDELSRKYTGAGGLNEFRARRKALVAEIATATAAGQALEAATLARLDTARALLAALQLAADAERAVARAEVLRRWVDWGVSRDALDAVLAPYRTATANAFEGFVAGPPAVVEQWTAERARYEPLLLVLARTARYGDACDELPDKLPGAVAKLFTPLADQTFATERAVRLAIDTCAHFRRQKDAAAAAAVLDALAPRLPR